MGTVAVESVDLRFGKQGAGEVVALNSLSMVITDNQFAVIVGPSGCGKSSLIDMIAGLRDPSGGVCKIDGKIIERPARIAAWCFRIIPYFHGVRCCAMWSLVYLCRAGRRRKQQNAPSHSHG